MSKVNAALGAVAERHKRSVILPHDMSVIAFPDVWCIQSVRPPLPTRRSPLFEMAKAAVDAFFESERSSQPILRVIVDHAPVVLVRSSTARSLDARPGSSPVVASTRPALVG